ncbi:MAG TPA: YWFCY domain-containing protein, partial [Puia sp.]|nr:YWFCY domain-containing protein [Puia sp.]
MQQNSSLPRVQLICGGFAIGLLALHFYYFCYAAFARWQLTAVFIDRLATHLAGPFHHKFISKLLVLLFATPALTAIQTDTTPSFKPKDLRPLIFALALYFGSDALLLGAAQPTTLGGLYIATTLAGLIKLCMMLLPITTRASRYFLPQVFNDPNETFPQQESLLPGPQSIHLYARYKLQRQTRKCVINIDPYPGTLVMGKPGSGKTRYIFRQIIRQSIANQMTMFVYDLKYPTLTQLTYNTLKNNNTDPIFPRTFYSLNFDDPSRSHRCNPIHPGTLVEISDAMEAATTFLLGLNKSWIDSEGEFFQKSAINFF